MTVTIGPFTNVPAPGDPIRSPWPQDISTWVATRSVPQYGSVQEFMAQYPAPVDGQMAVINGTPVWWVGGALHPMVPIRRSPADLSGNPGAGSTIAVSTPQSFGPFPVPYAVRVTTEIVAFGTSALGTVKPTIRTPDGASVLIDGFSYTVPASQAVSVPLTGDLLVNAGATVAFSVWVNAAGSACSIAGRAHFVLLPS